jgi:hypothetical protein
LNNFCDFAGCNRIALNPADLMLIAENTAMRASLMGNKNRDYQRS